MCDRVWVTISGCKGLSTLETIVADFGDNLSSNSATVAKTGDCCQIRRLSPKTATVAGFGDSRRIRQQSPVLATVAELVDYSRQCGQAITSHLGQLSLPSLRGR